MTDVIQVRLRIPTNLWPYEGLEGTGQQQMIAALEELQELRNLKAVLLGIDENPAIALGKLLQAYESSSVPTTLIEQTQAEQTEEVEELGHLSRGLENEVPLDQDEF